MHRGRSDARQSASSERRDGVWEAMACDAEERFFGVILFWTAPS